MALVTDTPSLVPNISHVKSVMEPPSGKYATSISVFSRRAPKHRWRSSKLEKKDKKGKYKSWRWHRAKDYEVIVHDTPLLERLHQCLSSHKVSLQLLMVNYANQWLKCTKCFLVTSGSMKHTNWKNLPKQELFYCTSKKMSLGRINFGHRIEGLFHFFGIVFLCISPGYCFVLVSIC